MGSNDLKRVGLIFTEEGAKDFKQTLQDINIEMNKNYNQFKLTQSQWDNSTKSTEKLKAQQEYLTSAYEIQSDKVNVLKMQLADLENAENKNTTAIKKKQNELTNAEIKLINYEIKLKDVQTQLKSTGKRIEEWGEKVEKSGKKIENAGKKLSAFSTASISALTLSAKSAIDFEDAFAGVEKTVDGTKEQMEELKQGIRDMAKEIPSSTTEISAVAEAAGQLGIKTEDILSFTRVMIDLGNSTNLTAEEAASSLAKFANITKMSAKDYDKLGSAIVDLGNNFATTEADIVAMAQNLASAGTQVGMSQSEILALSTALSSVGLEAQAGGTAFSKALINMQLAVETNSKSLKDWADVAGMSAKDFSKLFKEDATKALQAFIDGLSKCGGETESAIKVLDDMGITETRMRDALLRSANASEIFTSAIETGSEAWQDNTALTNEANKRYDTLKSKIKIAINKLKDMTIILGNKLMPSIEEIIEGLGKWIDKFSKLSDKEVDMIVKIGLIVAAIGPLVTAIGKVTSVIGGTIKGIGTFTQAIGVARGKITSASDAVNGLSKVITCVFSPTGIAIAAAVAGISILMIETDKLTKKEKEYTEECERLKDKVLEEKQAIDELRTSIDLKMQTSLNELDNTKDLWKELQHITDENGKIKEGYEGRANVITGALSTALGKEISITNNVIDKYKQLQKEIDTLILKKQAQIILDAKEEKYNDAIKNRTQKTQELIDLEEQLAIAIRKEQETKAEYESNEFKWGPQLSADYKNWKEAQKQLENIKTTYENTKTIVEEYSRDISDYNYTASLVAEGSANSLNRVVNSVGQTYLKNGQTVKTTLEEQIKEQQKYNKIYGVLLDEAVKNNDEAEKEKNQTQLNSTRLRLDNIVEELKNMTSITSENTDDVKNAWKILAEESYLVYEENINKMSPEMQSVIQNITGVIITNTPIVQDATNGLANEIINSLDKNDAARKSALELLNSYLTGLSDENKRKLLTDAGINDVENVMRGLKEGNLSEDAGIEILKGLGKGINNTYWKNQIFEKARTLAGSISNTISAITGKKFSLLPGHKNGLDYVPRDDYVARLHKGERVLTAQENKEYSRAETTKKVPNNAQKEIKQEINYDKMASAFLKALNSCKLTLDENGFAKIVKNELYEVL